MDGCGGGELHWACSLSAHRVWGDWGCVGSWKGGDGDISITLHKDQRVDRDLGSTLRRLALCQTFVCCVEVGGSCCYLFCVPCCAFHVCAGVRGAYAALSQYSTQTIADLRCDDDEMLKGVDWKAVAATAHVQPEGDKVRHGLVFFVGGGGGGGKGGRWEGGRRVFGGAPHANICVTLE